MSKVVKFGGSSLANATQFKKVYKIIKSDEERQYVVPSAPGRRDPEDVKVTDLLIKLYKHQSAAELDETFETIKNRFQAIIDELNITVDLEEDYKNIYYEAKNNDSYDYIVSRGEYLNGKILAAYLGFNFIDPKDYIFIDQDGNYDADKTDARFSEVLKANPYSVIPGFYGSESNSKDKIKAFSRGGSDVTGSIVAKCAHVDLYENWTDVSGFLMCDPRIVEGVQNIEIVTYKELRELSYMGASVLHENSIFPVRSQGIPIQIKNTNRPEDVGTSIVESTCHKPSHTITGIAGKKGFATITIEKDLMNSEVGFGRKVLQVLEENDLSFEHIPSGIDTLSVTVNAEDFIKKEQEVLAGIHRAVNPDSIVLEADLALIAVVGRGMEASHGCAAKVFTALAREDINIKMIDQGSSELNIIVGVKTKDYEKAINAIYREFIKD